MDEREQRRRAGPRRLARRGADDHAVDVRRAALLSEAMRTRSPATSSDIGTSAATAVAGAEPPVTELAVELAAPQQAECAATAQAALSRRRQAAVRSRPKHTASSLPAERGAVGGARLRAGGEAGLRGDGGGEPLAGEVTDTLTFCAVARLAAGKVVLTCEVRLTGE